MGQTAWLIGMIFLIASSLLGALNFIVTIVHLRAEGMTFFRLPFFVWSQLVTAFLLLLAFPALNAAAVLQLMDRLAGTSFFLPSGLVVGGEQVAAAGGGSPLLWQHLFWFLAHPEVYVLILPGMGIIAEVIANNTRKPLWGYRTMVYSLLVLGFLSFGVWAHHMFLTGMGTTMSTFFQTTTMIISIPSVIILSCLVISLWGGSIRFTVPMLFALAFLPMFGIGGLTGLPLGLTIPDVYLHDSFYVIGHFHYIVAPGTIFALFAGIYHWYPKATGRAMNDTLGKLHFWPSFLFMNGIFMPMMFEGMAGVSRRLFDPTIYDARRRSPRADRDRFLVGLGPRVGADPVHHQLLHPACGRRSGPPRIPGRRRRSNGRRQRRRRTGTSRCHRWCIAGRTSTARPARRVTSPRNT